MKTRRRKQGNTFFAVIGLLIFSSAIRLYKLDQIPTTLTHDETVYAVQAKSLAVQGTTLDKQFHWFGLQPIDPLYAEWPASLMAPFFWLTKNPLLATRLLPALLGASVPFLLGAIVWNWWRDKGLALATIFVSAANPFLWQFSRLAYDALYSTFFYLAGGVVMLAGKKYLKLLSIPLFLIGFFQYQGFKLLLMPWLVGVLGVYWLAKHQALPRTKKEIFRLLDRYQVITILCCLILTLAYIVVLLPSQNVGNRLQSVIWNDTQLLSGETNTQRRLSTESPFVKFQVNKITIMGDFIFNRFLSVFNPVHLFSSLNPTVNGFAVWRHGLFYALDALLICLGLWYLCTSPKTKRSVIGLFGLLCFLTFPAVINTMSNWNELRAFLMYSLMTVFPAAGLRFLAGRKYLFNAILIAYAASIVWFGFHYFYRYPVYSADSARFVERVVARYVHAYQQERAEVPVVVVTKDAQSRYYFFATYLLYSQQITKEKGEMIASAINQNSWSIDAVEFKVGCVDTADVQHKVVLYESGLEMCPTTDSNVVAAPIKTIVMPMINDSGELIRISGDTVCKNTSLSSYIHPTSLKVFDVENLSVEEFCQSWLINSP